MRGFTTIYAANFVTHGDRKIFTLRLSFRASCPIKEKTNNRKTGKLIAPTNKISVAKERMRIMASVPAAFPRVASFFLAATLAVTSFVRADDLTGMAQDDPKDLYPAPAPQTSYAPNYNSGFLPLPSWARGVVMPPLPDVLKPMGKKVVLTTPPVPAPQTSTPPKAPATPIVVVPRPAVVTPAPAPSPALIAVSPFLDWIKANPQAAAEQARQQAGTYQAGGEVTAATPTGTLTTPNVAPANGNAGSVVPPPAPYWMPPLIDTATFGTGTTTGSSAAIYSTPQR
jgi:hypothetical protein